MSYIDKKSKKVDKGFLKLSISTITNLTFYTLSGDENITKSNLFNLQKLLNTIDTSRYNEEKELPTIQRLKLLKFLVDNVLIDDFDYEDLKQLAKDTLNKSVPSNIIEDVFNNAENKEFGREKIERWNNFVETQLNMFTINKYLPSLKKIIDMFENPDFETLDENVADSKETLQEINKIFNSNKNSTDSKMDSFNIADRKTARKIIKKSINAILNPGNKITTGYQLLDQMMGGGMQGSRCYLLLGVAKSFKSGTLLNIAMNVACYYDDYELKYKDKTPAVLYFTMENSMIETFERIYNYLGLSFDFAFDLVTTKSGKQKKKYKITDEDIDNILDTIERETIQKTGVALRIEFKTHMSVDTGILDKLYDDYLTLDNQEIICVVQDYIKRIHSQRTYKTEQKRDELGEVVNEFCNFAKSKNIPVLTASQLNREALRVVENAKSERKKDIARKLGGSQVGESSLVYENADYSIILNTETTESGDKFVTFKCIMARGASGVEYFAQPFDPDPKYHGFRIATDIDNKQPLGMLRLSDEPDIDDTIQIENSPGKLKSIVNNKPKKILNFKDKKFKSDEIKLDEDDQANELI